MSILQGGYVACPTIQDALNTQFLCNPQMIQDAIGTLAFIRSEFNTNNTLQNQIDNKNGKYRKVELRYQPRFTDPSDDSAVQQCTATTEYGDTSKEYEIDPAVGKSRLWKITTADLAARCESDPELFAKQVQAHMDALARDINREAVQFVGANFGNFISGVNTPYEVQTKLASGAYSTDLNEEVIAQLQFIEFCNTAPFVFGDGELTKYMRALNAGCCALNAVDLGLYAEQNPIVLMRDSYVEQYIGTNEFYALGQGAIQMLTYNEFRSPVSMFNMENYKQGTLVDPKTGVEYDYFAKFDCGVWHFQLKLAFKFVTLPEDAFLSDDRLAGTNGILNFKIVNP